MYVANAYKSSARPCPVCKISQLVHASCCSQASRRNSTSKMGRNNSTTALNSPTMEVVFHLRSTSNLSTKSDDTVTSGSVARKGVRSIAEFPPVSSSVEDVSYTRTPTKDASQAQRHTFCPSKLATTERCASYSQQNKLKLAILGDSGVGKTSLLMSLTTDKVPETHAPTIYDKFSGECM